MSNKSMNERVNDLDKTGRGIVRFSIALFVAIAIVLFGATYISAHGQTMYNNTKHTCMKVPQHGQIWISDYYSTPNFDDNMDTWDCDSLIHVDKSIAIETTRSRFTFTIPHSGESYVAGELEVLTLPRARDYDYNTYQLCYGYIGETSNRYWMVRSLPNSSVEKYTSFYVMEFYPLKDCFSPMVKDEFEWQWFNLDAWKVYLIPESNGLPYMSGDFKHLFTTKR